MGKILFFGGKGGVGKTSCSGAFAVARAREGHRVLLVSTDPAHSTGDLFERSIGSSITKLDENLYSVEINPEEESDRYIESIRESVQRIYSPVIVSEIGKQLDSAKVSPGSHEAALFDRMVSLINETSDEYDYIVFDTAPTGHTLRLLTLPSLLESWLDSLLIKRKKALMYKEMYEGDRRISSGDAIIQILTRRRDAVAAAKKILLDSGRLGFVFVLNAEKLAIDETKKASDALSKYGVPILAYVVNRILPSEPESEFWREKKAVEAERLSDIERLFGGSKIYKIPLLARDMSASEVYSIADYFSGEKSK